MIQRCSWCRAWCNTDTGLLALRIGVGIIFIVAGWGKFTDIGATVGFFATLGFPAFLAYLVTAVELLGGVAVILGVFTRTAGALLAITMAVAIVVTYKDISTVFTPLALFFSSLALFFAGSGRYSLPQKLCGCGTCYLCRES